MTTGSPGAASPGSAPPDLTSASGKVAYRLFETTSGVVVQRTVRSGPLSRTDHFVRFADAEALAACAELEAQHLGEPRLAGRLMDRFGATLIARPAAASMEELRSELMEDRSAWVMKLIQRIPGAVSQADVLGLLHAATRALGADASVHVSVIPEPGSSPSLRMLFDGDAVAFHAYSVGSGVGNDPWLAYAQAQARRIVIEGNVNVTPPVETGLASMPEFRHALIIPTPGPSGLMRFGFLALGAARREALEGEGAAVQQVLSRVLAEEVSAWWFRASGLALVREARIDAIDLQILKLQQGGAAETEIAAALSMNVAEVTRRVRSLIKRLNAVDAAGAIHRATEYGVV